MANTQKTGLSYRDAGVDIDAGDALVERIKPLAARTRRPGLLSGIGGFGGLFQVPAGYREPVLVSGTDGVGTKLKLAFALDVHDTIGIGGDPVVGTTHIDALAAFEADPDTRLVVMIGEIGGDAEERAAAYIREHMTKPVVAYVAGFTAPEGRTMGHAGAIVSGSSGTAEAKKTALEAAGVRVGRTPSQTAEIARELCRALSDEVSA